ncbi:hypothetical protein SADUNF_Sadunf14G0069300 [Salix dunnii]|uniref:Ubiquitin-like domain-containing protein n=1 Tax=Salix dunnii TaxID=1413687 RepID=A0A835MTJ2_9ROSI|nr:hypothetical protein SADUNF_Sadunf14G0069300 [Salix dunnii]
MSISCHPSPKPAAMEDHSELMPFQIFANLLDGKTTILNFETPESCTAQSIKQKIFEITKIPIHYQRLICRGVQLYEDATIITPESTVYLLLRLLGGKGGFGSLLRGAATKAGQKKTNNFDACRDMSGRRLRHVNAEKKLEEWKAEEEDRRLEKIAEEFIKKKGKKGKKGAGDDEAEKYVARYRAESAKCAAVVEEAMKEVFGNGKGKGFRKRKGKGVLEGMEAKKLKIWMGKRKLGESDSDEENEKSVVLNNGNQSDSNNKAEVSQDSVTGNQDGECSGGASCAGGSEEEKEVSAEQSLISNSYGEIALNEEDEMVEAQILEETIVKTGEIFETEALEAEKQENVGPNSQCPDASDSGNGIIIESIPVIAEPNGFTKSKPVSNEIVNVGNADLEKPLNFDEFNSASELEVLGMERLKTELQARGLKCGGTLQERAARLLLLKSTPLEKLPKKLLAKK